MITTFLTWTTPLPAQPPPTGGAAPIRVAILPVDIGPNVEPGARMALTDELQQALFRTKKWSLINQAEMDKVLRQHKFNLSGCTTSECAVQVGRILQVQKIFTGRVTLLGETYSVSIRLTDVETGTVEKIVSKKCPGCKIDELFKLVERMAFEISEAAPEPAAPTPAPPREVKKPPPAKTKPGKPIYKKWWFWAVLVTVAGGGAAVIVITDEPTTKVQ